MKKSIGIETDRGRRHGVFGYFTVRRGATEEKFEGLSMSSAKGAQNAVVTVNKQSKLVTLEKMKVAGLSVAERASTPGAYSPAAATHSPRARGIAVHEFIKIL